MPTYDYQCKTCGRNFEWFQSMSAEKLTHCPESVCEQDVKGQGAVERKIGKGAGLIFSGSGFYLTDYTRSSGSSSDSSAPASSESKASAPSSETPAPPSSSSKE